MFSLFLMWLSHIIIGALRGLTAQPIVIPKKVRLRDLPNYDYIIGVMLILNEVMMCLYTTHNYNNNALKPIQLHGNGRD